MKARWVPTTVLSITVALTPWPVDSRADVTTQKLQLEQGGALVRLHPSSGAASFVQLSIQQKSKGPGLTRQQELDRFMDDHASVFGLNNHRSQLIQQPYREIGIAGAVVLLQQVHEGVEVLGGILKAHFDSDERLRAVGGFTIVEFPAPRSGSTVDPSEARLIALEAVSSGIHAVSSSSSNLDSVVVRTVWYHDGMIAGQSGQAHLAYEILVSDPSGLVRTMVYVATYSQKVLNLIELIHSAPNRRVYEQNTNFLVWGEGNPDPIPSDWLGGSPQQLSDWQREIDGAREAYNLFYSMTNGDWRSYDGSGLIMRSVNAPPITCPNAFWNGTLTGFCPGMTSDDIVVHEWGHAYTEYVSGLVYQNQSGALNESLSDSWGELVDMINSRGTDVPAAARSTGHCSVHGFNIIEAPEENSLRWLVGEDAEGVSGPTRDMWTPECHGDPGSLESDSYYCTTGDNGGVHSNSGVPNRAFAMMVDGDSNLGVEALGPTKSAHILWTTMHQLSFASRFSHHADALESSCASLIDVDLPGLDPVNGAFSSSGEAITATDCATLAAIISVTKLRSAPTQCVPLDLAAPELCAAEERDPIFVFEEDFEDPTVNWLEPPAGWTVGERGVTNPPTFYTSNWRIQNADGIKGGGGQRRVAAMYFRLAVCWPDSDEAGVSWLRSGPITVSSPDQRLAFDHHFLTEPSYDGGNVKVSVNGQAPVLAEDFIFNSYNDTLAGAPSTNPLAGEPGFSGGPGIQDAWYWHQSQLSLAGLAVPGDTIELLFELGTNQCVGSEPNGNWSLDQVQVYHCHDACGDTHITGSEQCDDGNFAGSDGCSSTCQTESGYTCNEPVPPYFANVVSDPGFEGGTPHADWNPMSSNYGSPICTSQLCSTYGAPSGSWYLWFGGHPGGEEVGSVSQELVIPTSARELSFLNVINHCDSEADFVELTIDGQLIWRQTGDDERCGQGKSRLMAILSRAIPFLRHFATDGYFSDSVRPFLLRFVIGTYQ